MDIDPNNASSQHKTAQMINKPFSNENARIRPESNSQTNVDTELSYDNYYDIYQGSNSPMSMTLASNINISNGNMNTSPPNGMGLTSEEKFRISADKKFNAILNSSTHPSPRRTTFGPQEDKIIIENIELAKSHQWTRLAMIMEQNGINRSAGSIRSRYMNYLRETNDVQLNDAMMPLLFHLIHEKKSPETCFRVKCDCPESSHVGIFFEKLFEAESPFKGIGTQRIKNFYSSFSRKMNIGESNVTFPTSLNGMVVYNDAMGSEQFLVNKDYPISSPIHQQCTCGIIHNPYQDCKLHRNYTSKQFNSHVIPNSQQINSNNGLYFPTTSGDSSPASSSSGSSPSSNKMFVNTSTTISKNSSTTFPMYIHSPSPISPSSPSVSPVATSVISNPSCTPINPIEYGTPPSFQATFSALPLSSPNVASPERVVTNTNVEGNHITPPKPFPTPKQLQIKSLRLSFPSSSRFLPSALT